MGRGKAETWAPEAVEPREDLGVDVKCVYLSELALWLGSQEKTGKAGGSSRSFSLHYLLTPS